MSQILATIGPASENLSNIKKIFKFTNFVRINGAHNSIKWHEKISKKIKKVNPDSIILIDFPGIKHRTLNSDNIVINKNEKIVFKYSSNVYKKKNLKRNYVLISKPLPKFGKTNFFSLSDGKYLFKYLKHGKNYLEGKSLQKFILLPKKGLNIPNSIFNNNIQEKIYIDFIKKIRKVRYDAIGLSYVQDSKIIEKIKTITKKIIVSKIENKLGCENVDKICKSSDAIMIDRGDLSAEVGDHNLFKETLNISQNTKKNGKLLIMATENLETMITNASPSKSEIISLSFSNSLNVDYFMLSDETATSKKFENILKWLKKFNIVNISNKNNQIKKLEKDLFYNNLKELDHRNSIIVIFTRKGYVIEKILKTNPRFNLVVFTDNKKIHTISKLRLNVDSYNTYKFQKNMDSFIYNNIKKRKKSIFKKNHAVFLVYAAFARKKSRANTLTIIEDADFI